LKEAEVAENFTCVNVAALALLRVTCELVYPEVDRGKYARK